jgi:short-subunit dehydrogenase
MTGTVLILGGRSDIGLATAHAFAAEGHAIQLAARGIDDLESAATDIHLRHGVPVTRHNLDALDTASFVGFFDSLPVLPEIAVSVIGLLGDQTENQQDLAVAARVMRTNYEAPALLLGLLAERFAARGSGVLVGVSSVAGERGRAKNYVYGSAKAGFTAFLSGLRNRLARTGVHVVTVLPGFVATRMTEGMATPAALTAQPEEVGQAIRRAVSRRRNVIRVRPVWRLVMLIIRAIPENLFKRLDL